MHVSQHKSTSQNSNPPALHAICVLSMNIPGYNQFLTSLVSLFLFYISICYIRLELKYIYIISSAQKITVITSYSYFLPLPVILYYNIVQDLVVFRCINTQFLYSYTLKTWESLVSMVNSVWIWLKLGPMVGVPVSHVVFKKWQCHMSLSPMYAHAACRI